MKVCKNLNECSPYFITSDFFTPDEDDKRPNFMIFAQVACSQSEETLAWKNGLGLAISCIGVAIALLFQFKLEYYYISCSISSVELDIELLSPEDFAIVADIPKEAWD